MTVSLLVEAIRSTVEATRDPAEILTALNRRLYGRMQNGFATCLVLRLHASGNGTLANTGHLPPFINRNEFALSPALPLGLVPEAEYETTPLNLGAGDRLTLYTDGLLEARSAGGELFGFARIAEVSGNTSEQIAKIAREFGQDDDITVLTLTLTLRAASGGFGRLRAASDGFGLRGLAVFPVEEVLHGFAAGGVGFAVRSAGFGGGVFDFGFAAGWAAVGKAGLAGFEFELFGADDADFNGEGHDESILRVAVTSCDCL